jgi:lipoate-protein ligase A
MQKEAKKYDLPDIKLLEEQPGDIALMVWRPERTTIVIGNGNTPEKSVNLELAEADGIDVLKRNSGGETVILSEKTMIISVVIKQDKIGSQKQIFAEVNKRIIDALQTLGMHGVEQKGISDLAVGPKKILGSAMWKGKGIYFYHAVLNMAEDIAVISKYLKHPEREPDYRKGRSHGEFVTSLKELGMQPDFDMLKKKIERMFMMHYIDKELVIYD